MKDTKNKILFLLGIFYISCWIFDFIINAVLKQDYSWLVWYSAAGFLLTGIALIIQNIKLIYSLFCALFVIETIWVIDFLYVLFTRQSVFGATEYMLSPTFSAQDYYITLYHVLIPIGLLIAVILNKKSYKYGWVGALIFASTLFIITYFFLSPLSQVNCIHSLNQCHTIFSFFYQINNPLRIFIIVICLTTIIYLPTNYILLYLKSNYTED